MRQSFSSARLRRFMQAAAANPDRRRWLQASGAGCLSFAIGGCDDSPSQRFRVSGPSMAPTLWGPHHNVVCSRCGIAFRIHAGALAPTGETFPCWHCGHRMGSPRTAALLGDVVALRSLNSLQRPLQSGDLVAIDWEGALRVKRLLALPGQTVRLAGNRLSVDGEPPDFSAVDQAAGLHAGVPAGLVPIDLDQHRSGSRWSPAAETDNRWRRRDRRWHLTQAPPSGWLVYRHESVYDGGRAGPVRDDYPGNAGLSRPLYPAEALVLDVEARFESAGEIEAVFFARGTRRAVRRRGNGACSLRFEAARAPVAGEADCASAPVGANRPVALRVVQGGAVLSRLTLQRKIQYRLRRRDRREGYPIQLAAGECFVAGDNVPVSVDSRDFGPLAIKRIVGVVERLEVRC